MPRPKPINYDPPLDLSKLPAPSAVTKRDKLKLLDDLRNRAGGFLATGINRITFNAIEADIRAASRTQRDGASATTGALSKADQRSEADSSIPEKALERKIADSVTVAIDPLGSINLYAHGETLICFTPDQAERAAHALTELAGDLRQDANARAWSQDLLNTTG